MGNIEIKEQRPRKMQSIFGERRRSTSRSPFKEVVSPKSPYYKHVSPIKYSLTSQTAKRQQLLEQSKAEGSSECRNKDSFFRGKSSGATESARQEWSGNRQKCQEIIKKVRNFNDFLLELKRKLRDDCAWQQQAREPKGEVRLSVKLENEKVELEKYKKLVERELSKTHSIDNISIENTTNGQKILTIHYENNVPAESRGSLEETNKIVQRFKESQQEAMETSLQAKSTLKKDTQKWADESTFIGKPKDNQQMRQIKTIFGLLKRQCKQLGEQLDEQQNEENGSDSLEFLLKIKEKTVRIQNMLGRLQSTNLQSVQIQKRIRNILQ